MRPMCLYTTTAGRLFRPHLKQIWSYAVHRGYFVKKFPETSLRLSYFVPSLFVIGLAGGLVLSLLGYEVISIIYVAALVAYLMGALVTGMKTGDVKMAITVAAGIALTHIYYGVGFILGLLTPSMDK